MKRRQEVPATTTRGPQKTIRFAKGSDLLAWYEALAEAEDLSTNGALIVALQEFRQARERKQQPADRERTAS